jgi:serine/threonine protein kinase
MNTKIGGGAFASIYLVEGDSSKVVKVYTEESKEEACVEIETLTIIKNNRKSFKDKFSKIYGFMPKSNIITIKGWDDDDENNIQVYFKKYDMNLEELYKKYYLKYKDSIPKNVVKYITMCCMNGLQELKHSGLVHGDLKPDNIMIKINLGKKKNVNILKWIFDIGNKKESVDASQMIVKIIDFNKSQQNCHILKSLSIQTVYYMPPEIIVGDRKYNNSVDMWAMGCIIYEILTGDILFDLYNKNSIDKEERYLEEENSKESSKESSNEYYESKEEHVNNIAILHLYSRYIGDIDLSKDNLKGIFLDDYFINNQLIGYGSVKTTGGFSWANIDEYFKTLFIRIFNYNYNKRLSIEEYFTYFNRV